MSCSSSSLEQFLQDHVINIQQLLVEATTVVKPASKRVRKQCFIHCYGNLFIILQSRMKCIHHLVHNVTPLSTEFLCRVIPEVILSLKEVKGKTRSLAATILIDIGHTYDQKSIAEYFKLIVAGLAGSAHMISATIMSLTRLVYVFHGNHGSIFFMLCSHAINRFVV